MRVLTRSLFAILFSLALAPALVGQEKGRIDTAIASDSRETMEEKKSFPPTQAKIYVFAMVADAPKDTPVKAVWIAEKVEGQKPDTKFAERTTKFPGWRDLDSLLLLEARSAVGHGQLPRRALPRQGPCGHRQVRDRVEVAVPRFRPPVAAAPPGRPFPLPARPS